MFQDEAGFGRINKPKYCWCEKGVRPNVPCYHIREYRYAYGAVEPLTGESCFLVMPYCNTACMNLFLQELSSQFPEDTILLCCDGAAWHKSRALELPDNIVIFHIPPYTPEMNPIEQIWKEIRKLTTACLCNSGEIRTLKLPFQSLTLTLTQLKSTAESGRISNVRGLQSGRWTC